MSQLTDNLSAIVAIKSNIKDAIESKGVDMTGVSFGSYADKIGEITTQFVTETLNVSVNNTYYPSQGVDGFSQVVVDVPQSVTGFTEKDVTEANIQIVNLNNSASYVASEVFISNSTLLTVNLPECTVVNQGAFSSCSNLTYASLPRCTTFSGLTTFGGCNKLSSIYVPLLMNVPNNAFVGCSSLSMIDLPEARSLGASAFMSCVNLSQINIPKVTYIGNRTFWDCSSLKSFYAPECLSISGGLEFNRCVNLESADFPVLWKISGGNTFNGCNKLVSVSMPMLYSFTSTDYCFRDCHLLSEINLPLLYNFASGYNFTNCSSLERLVLPLWYSNPYYSNYRDQGFGTCSRLSEVTIGTGLYFVPSYLSLGSYFINNNGVINIDAEMYDKWLSASGWSSMSAHFRSYVSTNLDPLLSVSDGVLYGRTKMLVQGTSSVQWSYYVSDWSTIVNVSLPECEVLNDCFVYGPTTIRTLYLPKLKLIPASVSLNYSITSVYFGELEVMSTIRNLDRNCSVTIATSKVCKCLSTNAFYNNVPDSIYVPASLVDAYKSAPVWSDISTHIFPIPE